MSVSQKMESLSNTVEENYSLHDKWVLWAHLPHDTEWTLNSYIKIMEVTTIGEVISLTNSVPDLMIKNCMLFFMRKNINPTWEDPKNCEGGCFSFKVLNKNVPSVWKDLSYILTGETLSADTKFQENVTGITISPKKAFCILKIWMSKLDYQNPRIIKSVDGLDIRGCLFKKHKPNY
tara:strand:+ start:259 stop:789 length:531 start_codon:yes stop_codon:yes gene_type:complete